MHPAKQRRAKKPPKRPQQTASPYDLGWHYGALRWRALEQGQTPPMRPSPFPPGTPQDADWIRGWRAAANKFARERVASPEWKAARARIDNCNNP
jgi:hypothetical protein